MAPAKDELPEIVAVLVAAFHSRQGYQILWSKGQVDLSGCEYKTLPSGVDKVQEDVIYFTKSTCIGLAAYKNLQAPAMHGRQDFYCISIAVLIQNDSSNLRHQRLNRIWLYNSVLRDLADRFDPANPDYKELEKLYTSNRAVPDESNALRKRAHANLRGHSPPASPVLSHRSSFKDYQSFRAERQVTQVKTTSLLPSQELSNLHPVLSLHDCISLFGPLILPVYRAALARRRILLTSDAPIQRACHFIYNIMLISAIPNNTGTMTRPLPLKQLFCIGLNDIPFLESLALDADNPGWIAVTTDSIFEKKTQLYDLLIKLPPDISTQDLKGTQRPLLFTSDGSQIKPSYLDAKNFSKLKPLLPMYQTGLRARPEPSWKRSILDSIIAGAWYWSSAGRSLELEDDEIYLESADESGLTLNLENDDHETNSEHSPLLRPSTTNASGGKAPLLNGRDEVILLVLFHRMTSNILGFLDELCCESPDEEIKISREKMVSLGLTPRLDVDVKVMEALMRRWYSRGAIIDKSFWPCC